MIGTPIALAVAGILSAPATRSEVRRRLHGLHRREVGPTPKDRPRTARSPRWLPWAAVGALAILGAALAQWRGLVASIVLAPVLYLYVRRVAARPGSGAAAERAQLPLVLDLVAAALRAGAPVAVAVGGAAVHGSPAVRAELGRTSALLLLGATPEEAWRSVGPDSLLRPLAELATRSADSGIRLATGLDRRATELRAQLRTDAISRAERVGVLALLPLGLCFLPAFICLGVVPTIVGVAGDAFGQINA